MANWYKLRSLYEGKEEWIVSELKKGNLRFGWSPPGSNLLELDKHSWKELDKMVLSWPDWEASGTYVYKQGQFLINRIEIGDRIVVQTESPFVNIYLFEVTEGYKYAEIEQEEFNHILKGKLFNEIPISNYSSIVSNMLRHDLSKRRRYYQIYSEDSCAELDDLIKNQAWATDIDERFNETEINRMDDEILTKTIEIIQKRWPAKNFEAYICELLKNIDGIDVKTNWDSHSGWDLTISIRDKLTGEILHDDVPVQCKNYFGNVETNRPIEDIERCFENSNSNVDIAYLFILGDISEEYYARINNLENELRKKYDGRNISIRVVDQIQIAKLYLEIRQKMMEI
jgi:hypothetical protein